MSSNYDFCSTGLISGVTLELKFVVHIIHGGCPSRHPLPNQCYQSNKWLNLEKN